MIAADDTVDTSAQIGPHVVIGARMKIGAGTVIGDGVVLGANCRIHDHVSISYALLGARVTLSPVVRVGQDGFGFTPTEMGFLTTPQLGVVAIGEEVETRRTAFERGRGETMVEQEDARDQTWLSW